LVRGKDSTKPKRVQNLAELSVEQSANQLAFFDFFAFSSAESGQTWQKRPLRTHKMGERQWQDKSQCFTFARAVCVVCAAGCAFLFGGLSPSNPKNFQNWEKPQKGVRQQSRDSSSQQQANNNFNSQYAAASKINDQPVSIEVVQQQPKKKQNTNSNNQQQPATPKVLLKTKNQQNKNKEEVETSTMPLLGVGGVGGGALQKMTWMQAP
jgi:hypothetical protein